MLLKENFSSSAEAALTSTPTLPRRDRLVLAQLQATLGSVSGTPGAAARAEAASVLALLQTQHTQSAFGAAVVAQLSALSSRLAVLGS
jgi:hypothetical protein